MFRHSFYIFVWRIDSHFGYKQQKCLKKTHCLEGRWNKELKHPPHLTKTAKLIYTATLLPSPPPPCLQLSSISPSKFVCQSFWQARKSGVNGSYFLGILLKKTRDFAARQGSIIIKTGVVPKWLKKLGFYLWRSTLGAAGCLPATLVVDSVCR